MFGNNEESGKTSKGQGAKIFFALARQKNLLKLALVWMSVKVEGKTPVRGIRLISSEKPRQ